MSANELIERLRGLLTKATPGPWYTLDAPWLPAGAETSILAESPDPHVARFICDFDLWALDDDEDRKSECPDADAALIVAAVNELPGILDLLESQAAEIERLTSDDAIEAAAKAHCDFFGGDGWWDSGLLADTKPRAIEAMRIAIQALQQGQNNE